MYDFYCFLLWFFPFFFFLPSAESRPLHQTLYTVRTRTRFCQRPRRRRRRYILLLLLHCGGKKPEEKKKIKLHARIYTYIFKPSALYRSPVFFSDARARGILLFFFIPVLFSCAYTRSLRTNKKAL